MASTSISDPYPSQTHGCRLFSDRFDNQQPNGPFLDAEWKCRKCQQLPADHPPQSMVLNFLFLFIFVFSF
jgi:hypothetical protein